MARREQEEDVAPRKRSSASKRQPVLERWPERVREEIEFENGELDSGETEQASDDEGQDAA